MDNHTGFLLILFLGSYIVLLWAMLPAFWRYMLPSSSGLKCGGWWVSEISATLSTTQGQLASVINHCESLKSTNIRGRLYTLISKLRCKVSYVFVANLTLINGCSYWNQINLIKLYVIMAKDKSLVGENIFVWVCANIIMHVLGECHSLQLNAEYWDYFTEFVYIVI